MNSLFLAMMLGLSLGAAACERDEGPAEETREEVEDAAEEAEDAVD